MALMATLTNYSIVRMGARTPVSQPDSAAPALWDTQQVIVLPACHQQDRTTSGPQEFACNTGGPYEPVQRYRTA